MSKFIIFLCIAPLALSMPSYTGGMPNKNPLTTELEYSRGGKPLNLNIAPVKITPVKQIRPVTIAPMRPMDPMRPIAPTHSIAPIRPMDPMRPIQGLHIKRPNNRIFIPDGKRAADYDYRSVGASLGDSKSRSIVGSGKKDKVLPKTGYDEPPANKVIEESDGMGGAGGLGGGLGGFGGDVTKKGKSRMVPADGENLNGAGVKWVDRKRGDLGGVIPSDLNRVEGPNGAGYLGRGKDWEHW